MTVSTIWALQPIGITHILPEHFVGIEMFQLVQLIEKPIDLDHIFFKFGSKRLRIEQVLHSDTDPRHLIGIGRANPSPCRANPARAFGLFRCFVDGLVIGQDEVGALAHDKILSDLHALNLEMVQLFDQRGWVHDEPPFPISTEGPSVERMPEGMR